MASYMLVNTSLTFMWWTVMSIVDILNTLKQNCFTVLLLFGYTYAILSINDFINIQNLCIIV